MEEGNKQKKKMKLIIKQSDKYKRTIEKVEYKKEQLKKDKMKVHNKENILFNKYNSHFLYLINIIIALNIYLYIILNKIKNYFI